MPVAAFVAVCWWVFMEKGLASATYEAFDSPGLLLLVVAVTVLSAGFHEFGHAAAARRGGATPVAQPSPTSGLEATSVPSGSEEISKSANAFGATRCSWRSTAQAGRTAGTA